MNIRVGSHNQAKLNAVQSVYPEATIEGVSVPSNVSTQPVSDEETRTGAINRASQCMDEATQSYGIGLEGGIMIVADKLYLCNWGALKTPSGELLTASGARIELPSRFEKLLEGTSELGIMMDAYTKQDNIREGEGAIGIFTNGMISRSDMFVHVVKLLKGQMTYRHI